MIGEVRGANPGVPLLAAKPTPAATKPAPSARSVLIASPSTKADANTPAMGMAMKSTDDTVGSNRRENFDQAVGAERRDDESDRNGAWANAIGMPPVRSVAVAMASRSTKESAKAQGNNASVSVGAGQSRVTMMVQAQASAAASKTRSPAGCRIATTGPTRGRR